MMHQFNWSKLQINVRNYDPILIRVNELILHEASHTIFTILRESFFAMLKKKKNDLQLKNVEKIVPHHIENIVAKILIVTQCWLFQTAIWEAL